MNQAERAARIALPIGDPHGIGPEIALKTVEAYEQHPGVALTLFGPAGPLQHTARQLGLEALLSRTAFVETPGYADSAFEPSRISADAGRACIDAASAAITATSAGHHDAVVAAPHHETAIHQAGIAFSGYPSLVARVRGVPEDSVFLMLVGGGLRIVHATLHESVRTALDRLTPELVVAATRAGARACALLGVEAPRIGLFGINPHASESTLFGPEDAAIVRPAAAALRAEGFEIDGPYGADMLLAQRGHDLYVAMLHDQGHIPIKLLAPHAASALSIGGDVLLSSVGHGSAMDIAGRGVASPEAMIRTVALLANCAVPGSGN